MRHRVFPLIEIQGANLSSVLRSLSVLQRDEVLEVRFVSDDFPYQSGNLTRVSLNCEIDGKDV